MANHVRPRNIDNFAKVLGVNSSWLLFGNETSDLKLNSKELEIIKKYRNLNSKDKEVVRRIICSLSNNEE